MSEKEVNRIKNAFSLFDSDESKNLERDELQGLLSSLGMPAEEKDVDRLMTSMTADKEGKIDRENFVKAITTRAYEDRHVGRYVVVVSLAEAESIYRLMHVSNAQHKTLGGKTKVELTMRNHGSRRMPLAIADGTKPMPEFQRETIVQCLRIIDGDQHYTRRELSLLCLALGDNKNSARESFYKTLLPLRRRSVGSWEDKPVSGITHLLIDVLLEVFASLN